jgi:YesN/AraC family two-component response regulator
MDIGSDRTGNCFCIRVSNDLTEDEKEKTLKMIKKEFTLMEFFVLLNWKNCTLTVVIFNGHKMIKDTIYTTMKELLFTLLKRNNLEYTVGIGLPFEEISQIEESYNYARSAVGDVQTPWVEIKPEEATGHNVPNEIKKICDFIEDHYSKKINLDDIVEVAGFSKYYSSRLFKQHMGITIIDYLTQTRIDKAKMLLQEGTHSIKQISAMVGYSDPNYFTWTFKKIVGIAPVKYRYTQK